MSIQTFTLQELADRTGIEPRTIRSYIERDLLPGPDGRGRAAAYGPEHLHRLLAIEKLRAANKGVQLDGIRQLLQQLPPEQIEQIATGALPIVALIDTDAPPPAGSALDYAKTALADDAHTAAALARHGLRSPWTHQHIAHGLAGSGPRTGGTRVERLLDALSDLARAAGIKRVEAKVQSEAWHRLPITRDIELSVRGPLDPEQLIKLQEIGDHLRHFLTKGVRP